MQKSASFSCCSTPSVLLSWTFIVWVINGKFFPLLAQQQLQSSLPEQQKCLHGRSCSWRLAVTRNQFGDGALSRGAVAHARHGAVILPGKHVWVIQISSSSRLMAIKIMKTSNQILRGNFLHLCKKQQKNCRKHPPNPNLDWFTFIKCKKMKINRK